MKHIYIFTSISRSLKYGVGTYIENLVTALMDLNIKITIVQTTQGELLTTTKMQHNVRYINIPHSTYNNPFISYDQSIYRYKKSLATSLIPFISSDEENIFHLNSFTDNTLSAYLKEFYNALIILTVHYTDWSEVYLGNKTNFLELVEKDTNNLTPKEIEIMKWFNAEKDTARNHCDKIIAISQHSYNDLVNLYKINPEKITLISNSIKDTYKHLTITQRKQIKEKLLMDDHNINIVFAGRLDEIKGIFVLAEALKIVIFKHKNIRLYIAGEGSFAPLMSAMHPICSKVSFMGHLNKKDLYELYSVADIGVAPSIHEEFGFIAIEMMMYKLPIITSDSTGFAEIVEHEKTGLKTNIKADSHLFKLSAQNLADNIIYLIENQELRNNLGLAGREKFKSRYELTQFKEKIMELYQITDL